jgi:hypothetical protein
MLALHWVATAGEWKNAAVVKALVAEIPELLVPHPELEVQVLGHRESELAMPGGYHTLGQVLA